MFDLISGWTGTIAYLIERRDSPQLRSRLCVLLTALVRLIVRNDHFPAWYTPGPLCADKNLAAQYPGGVLNCGLAHGIPGPLAVLSLAYTANVTVAGIEQAIRRCATWLLDHAVEDEFGMNWPSVVPIGSPRSEWSGSWAAWCYGAPGVSRAMWFAGKALGENSWQALAVAAMESVFRRPMDVRGIFSPTFCHGLAGLLSVALRFANETQSEIISNGAKSVGQTLIDRFEPNAPLGYRSEDLRGVFVDRPGLIEGAPGVVLALLAGATDIEPTWDRLFLLS